MSAPIYNNLMRPIPRSPTFHRLPIITEEQEIDISDFIDKKYEEDRIRRAAEAHEKFIVESRMKLFRHIYGVKLKTEK